MATRVEGVERWERSGLVAEELARHEGYKLCQLYWCRWKLRAYGPSQPLPWSSTDAPRFLPVQWWPTPRRSWPRIAPDRSRRDRSTTRPSSSSSPSRRRKRGARRRRKGAAASSPRTLVMTIEMPRLQRVFRFVMHRARMRDCATCAYTCASATDGRVVASYGRA
ncbi:uncharacterized protein SOCE26_001770 [Sorangium cellulosum]|uniref:Uncharacterized protein n=1 Tax=Sorangium cellulosum TaxID=56 RepID=A0A2L0EHN7_SORCE|nr:uncharacterized protein SOCE26_001770 [Sorangium cellulosum]